MKARRFSLQCAAVRQDETALVREAVRQAQLRLERGEPVLPAAYMLVQVNPQTGAALTYPTAIGLTRDKPFESQTEYLEFAANVRAEARRLRALAVALSGEAQAELDDGGVSRVLYVRVEDAAGIHHLSAIVERAPSGALSLGPLYDAGAAEDDLPEPLLPLQQQ